MGKSRRWRISVIIVLLIMALSACERPLLEREAEPISEPAGTPEQTFPLAVPTPVLTPLDESGLLPAEGAPAVEEPEQPAEESPAEPAPDSEIDASQIEYVVQSGDTLGLIAQRYNVSIEALAAANGIGNVDVLDIGQTLIIPLGEQPVEPSEPLEPAEPVDPADPPVDGGEATVERVHIVQAGENLYRIGLLYGFTYQELAAYNGLADSTSLSVGQEIRIPPTGN